MFWRKYMIPRVSHNFSVFSYELFIYFKKSNQSRMHPVQLSMNLEELVFYGLMAFASPVLMLCTRCFNLTEVTLLHLCIYFTRLIHLLFYYWSSSFDQPYFIDIILYSKSALERAELKIQWIPGSAVTDNVEGQAHLHHLAWQQGLTSCST